MRQRQYGSAAAAFDALVAADASACSVDKLRTRILTFWVMAPPTTQRTTLKEYCSANPWPIMDRILPDVKDHALFQGYCQHFQPSPRLL